MGRNVQHSESPAQSFKNPLSPAIKGQEQGYRCTPQRSHLGAERPRASDVAALCLSFPPYKTKYLPACCGQGKAAMQGVEARDAAKDPTVLRTAPWQRMTSPECGGP